MPSGESSGRETALENELVRVYALLHDTGAVLAELEDRNRPPDARWVRDRVENIVAGAPASPLDENFARARVLARFPAENAEIDENPSETVFSDGKTRPAAENRENPHEIEPGSVWRRRDGFGWVEYVVKDVGPWSPGVRIVTYQALLHGISTGVKTRAYEDDFRRGWRFVHGPTALERPSPLPVEGEPDAHQGGDR